LTVKLTVKPAFRLRSWQLFGIAVLIWSTTWHAILYQLAHTTPEVGVMLRFALAGAIALGIAAWRGDRLRCLPREWALLALQGMFMYSMSYLAVYHAEQRVPSGLVAVGYSASPLVNGIAAWLLWRTPLSLRFLVGGVLCALGVALIFAPEFAHLSAGPAVVWGTVLTAAAVLLSSVGNLAASRNAQHGLPLWTAIGWGMLFGAALSCVVVLGTGQSVTLPAVASWWASLLYLSVAGSVIAFACYLALQQRIGLGPSATVGVMTPVFALVISAVFEGYQPVLLSWLGVALAVAGNALILLKRSASEPMTAR
jgi:drug/metabolite transporter (DMT)-like permease